MADESKRKLCFVIGPRGPDKSDKRHSDWLFGTIIVPAMNQFPQFDVKRVDQLASSDLITNSVIGTVIDADIVIADLTLQNANTMYELGIRHAVNKPVIHLISEDYLTSFDVTHYQPIKYTNEKLSTFEMTQNAIISRMSAILGGEIDSSDSPLSLTAKTVSPFTREHRLELAGRVEKIANAIANLRINSLSESVNELRHISEEITLSVDGSEAVSLEDTTTRALAILANLFDALGSKQGAQVIIAGAVGGILSAGGWPAVSIYGLTLAVWQGKDAFMLALDRLLPQKNGPKTPRKSPKR